MTYEEALAKQKGWKAPVASRPRNPMYGTMLFGAPVRNEIFYDNAMQLVAFRDDEGNMQGEIRNVRFGVIPLWMMPKDIPANIGGR